MTVTASELRRDVYNLLQEAGKGKPVIVTHKGNLYTIKLKKL